MTASWLDSLPARWLNVNERETRSLAKDGCKTSLTPTFYLGDIEAMDIKAKYNDLFYKTCLMIEAIDNFEKFIKENIVSSDEIIYDSRFVFIRRIKHLIEEIAIG